MTSALRLVQRHAAIVYVAAVIGLLPWLLTPGAPEAVPVATWAIAQGIGIVWLGSGAWAGRERWAVRTQITCIGAVIVVINLGEQAANVAAAGLVVFMAAVVLLHFAHITTQSLRTVQDALVTTTAIARVEATRQALFYATFAAPVALIVAPGPIGVGLLVGSCFLVGCVVTARTRRHLAQGLSRLDAE